MYNRVTSYDNIVSEMEKQASEPNPPQGGPEHSGFSIYRIFSKSSAPLESATIPTYPPSSAAPTSLRKKTIIQRAIDYLRGQLPSLDPKDLLPLSVEIAKAVVICGNAATSNLLIIDAGKADGILGIVPVCFLPSSTSIIADGKHSPGRSMTSTSKFSTSSFRKSTLNCFRTTSIKVPWRRPGRESEIN
jgi:hypothetical protein